MEGSVVAYDSFGSEQAWSDIEHRRFDSLEEVLGEADVVTLHVPLTAGTRISIGRVQLQHMKRMPSYSTARAADS